MNEDATLWAACGRFSASVAPLLVKSKRSLSPLDWLNATIARWEDNSPLARRMGQGIALPLPHLSPRKRHLIGAAMAAWGLALLVLIIVGAWFEVARFGVATIATAFAVFYVGKLTKPPVNTGSESRPPAPGSVRLLGQDVNLIVLQLALTVYMGERAYWMQVDQARWAAVAVIALAALLYTAKVRLVPLTLAVIAVVYLIEVAGRMEGLSFLVRANRHVPDSLFPLWPVFYGIAAAAVFPQLALVRCGDLRIGAVRGDRVVRCFGSRVVLAFGSAVLFAAAATTLVGLLYLPFWISVVFFWVA